MRYQTAITLATITVLIAAVTCTAQQVLPAKPTSDSEPSPTTGQHAQWGVVFAPIPEILRLHCRPLGRRGGLLVDEVTSQSPAEGLGIRQGDILQEVDGVPLGLPADLGDPQQVIDVKIVRRGAVRFLPMDTAVSGRWPRFGRPNPMTATPRGGVSATSVASGSQSVSINRVGDRISLNLSVPELGIGPVRYEGTFSEIEQQIEASTLSPQAKRPRRTDSRPFTLVRWLGRPTAS